MNASLVKFNHKKLVKKSERKNLTNDPNYLELIKRYRRDFERFCIEILGYQPTLQQSPVMHEMQKIGFNISVVSGHGTGKSRMYASCIIWNMVMFPFSNGIITSPNLDQLKKVVWKELEGMLQNLESSLPWIQGQFELMAESYHHKLFKKSWFFAPKTAPLGKPENVAGMHNRRYVVLVDEASGVADATLAVLRGALTEEDNCFMMVSQGTRNTGTFYESHNQKKHLYKCFRMDSEQSILVTIRFISERLDEYGGFHSTNYQVKVKGAFPDNQSGFLIPRSWAEMTCRNDLVIEHDTPPGIIISVDVAGEGRDSSVILVALVSGYKRKRKLETLALREFPFMSNTQDLVDQVIMAYREFGGNGTIIVDGIGIGAGVCDGLDKKGIPNIRFRSGDPSFLKKEYRNKRAEGFWMLREAVFHSNIKTIEMPKLYDQMANLPYKYNENGQFQMKSKDEMAIMNIKSPDLADVYMQAFVSPYEPEIKDQEQDEEEELSIAKALMEQYMNDDED